LTIVLHLVVPYDPNVPQAYQTFEAPYPRFALTALPSPLERADRLGAALRAEGCVRVPRIYIKRDDLLSLALGGNKIRNLEFLIAHALEQGATDVVTAGRVQSNHCRLTAAACARAGLRAHLIFTGARPAVATANFLLDDLFGARTYFTGSDDRASRVPWVDMFMGALPDLGRRPYLIPVGGSDARGAIGHALAAQELALQCDAIGERLTTIVLATATGGTQAGMLAGLRKFGSDARLRGFAVAKSAADLTPEVLAIASEVAGAIGGPPVTASDVVVDGAFLGAGYGIPSVAGSAAIELLARAEGVLADPVYTGKAFAGLLGLVRSGTFSPDEAVVFIHTGGAPALFADLATPV
jgi:1-aminocyclopropane-1-carboxylate deaminase/D-cysteine desulfhydrase-like pyridoxal-dependent ACC family enzyme